MWVQCLPQFIQSSSSPSWLNCYDKIRGWQSLCPLTERNCSGIFLKFASQSITSRRSSRHSTRAAIVIVTFLMYSMVYCAHTPLSAAQLERVLLCSVERALYLIKLACSCHVLCLSAVMNSSMRVIHRYFLWVHWLALVQTIVWLAVQCSW